MIRAWEKNSLQATAAWNISMIGQFYSLFYDFTYFIAI